MPAPPVFDEGTKAWVHGLAIADITDTADGTYSANEQTMLGNLKTAVNAILAVLRSRGDIAAD